MSLKNRIFSFLTGMPILLNSFPAMELIPADSGEMLRYQKISTSPENTVNETVTLDGIMPADATVSIQNADSLSQGNLFAYDISITDHNGNEFQPEENTPVRVEITNQNLENHENLRLWHIDDQHIREEIRNFTVENNTISFEASGFSVYEVDDGSPPLRTYQFQIPDRNGEYQPYYFPVSGTKKICQQTIKNHETLIIPQLPADVSGQYTFAGWYDDSDTEFDFQTIPEITQTETVILHAVFRKYLYAVFHNQYDPLTGSFPVSAVRQGEFHDQTAEISINDINISYDSPDDTQMIFKGWSKEPVSEAGALLTDHGNPIRIESEPLVISETTHLYPVFEKISWITFFTGETGSGATYIPPESFVSENGFDFSSVPIPVRSGYVFDGWYTEDHVQITDSDNILISSVSSDQLEIKNNHLFIKNQNEITLYAHWSPASTAYTVVIWKQKASDAPDLPDSEKSYDFSESFSLEALTGSMISIDDNYKNLAYTGFTYSHCSDAVTADGKAIVLDVYYDRNIHVFTFRNHNQIIRTVRALYGADISHIWNFTGSDGISYPRTDLNTNTSWIPNGSEQYTQRLTQMLLMPDEDIVFDYTSTSHTKRYFHYYVEALPEDQITRIYHDQNYIPYHENLETVVNDFNYLYYEEDFLQFEGFDRFETASPDDTQVIIDHNTRWKDGWQNHLYFYYTRKSYHIEFIDSVSYQTIFSTSLPYQQKTEDFIPDAPQPPTGYQFTGWYADASCSIRVFFHEPSETEIDSSRDSNGIPHYQVYEKMPAYPLRLYAGWQTQWFLIEIDPDGGELADGQSTWFWESYNGDPVAEYTQTTRNYIPDPDGEYYYTLHDRAYYHLDHNWNPIEDHIHDRKAEYTENIADATSDVRYKKSSGNYSYLGWYRVNPETGEETPYHFGTRITENLFLRLHWKQLGTYYIQYDAGEGTLSAQDDTQQIFQIPDMEQYSDQAEMLITKTAVPPEGKNFIGWKIKLDTEQKLYTAGQSFRFDSALTEPIAELNSDNQTEIRYTLIMQAVYQEIQTAEIIYDANGGVILPEAELPENAGETVFHLITPEYQRTEHSLIISDLVNNSAVQLANGTGFRNGNYILLGWNTEKDGSGIFYPLGSIQYVDIQNPVTLYAQWGIKIMFDKNNSRADWGGDWSEYQKQDNYYYKIINLNSVPEKPEDIPVSPDSGEMFRYWSADQQTPFDFSQPITQEILDDHDFLILYGCWDIPVEIPVYIVDTSQKSWKRQDEWLINDQNTKIKLNNTPVSLNTKADADLYAKPEKISGYQWAFSCTGENTTDAYLNISENHKITSIRYDSDSMQIMTVSPDGSEQPFDPESEAIYLIYYQNSDLLNINYQILNSDHILQTVPDLNSEAVKTAEFHENHYLMENTVIQPLSWSGQNYPYYSFAIGEKNAESSSDLYHITEYSGDDTSRPVLQIKTTWQGFQYTTDGSTWHSCGYEIALYVIFYEETPVIFTLEEQTIALPQEINQNFYYTVSIMQSEIRTSKKIYYYKNNNYYTELSHTEQTDISDEIQITEMHSVLSDDESESFVLFSSNPVSKTDYLPTADTIRINRQNYPVYYQEITEIKIIQKAEIIQEQKENFSTFNTAMTSDCYSSSVSASQTITYINTQEYSAELHVAVMNHNILYNYDNILRTQEQSVYQHPLPTEKSLNLSDIDSYQLITDAEKYVFTGIISASRTDTDKIISQKQNINSVTFGKISDNFYQFYLNQDQSLILNPEEEIWFVYVPKPVIRYVLEKPDGELLPITPLTRNGSEIILNQMTITQNMLLPISSEQDFQIAPVSGYDDSVFIVPPDLDYENSPLMLKYSAIGIGNESGLTESSDMKKIKFHITDQTVNYYFQNPDSMKPLPADPVIYIIYKIKGCTLHLTKTVKGDSHGNDAYILKIRSDALADQNYDISGDRSGTVRPDSGIITLTIRHGEHIMLHGLQSGIYIIQEETPEDCIISAEVNHTSVSIVQNQIAVQLNTDIQIDIINTFPVPVTEITENPECYLIITGMIFSAVIILLLIRKKKIRHDTQKG